MLDRLAHTDSRLQPTATAKSHEVQHLALEDLEAYANGRLAPARLEHCRAHLDACEACRVELEDLRALRSEMPGAAHSSPSPREPKRRKRRRGVTLPTAASVAIIVVAVGSTVVWWGHANPRTAAGSVAEVPGASIATAAATRTGASNPPEARTLPVAMTSPAARTLAVGSTLPAARTLPVAVASQVPNLGGTREVNVGFALLAPLGDEIWETRPEFSWQPLAGAVRYSVVIVDAGLHPVQRSRGLRTTVWRPRRPLRRGRTYLWQVTATLRGGTKVVASGPSPSGALLRVLPLVRLSSTDAYATRPQSQ